MVRKKLEDHRKHGKTLVILEDNLKTVEKKEVAGNIN